MVYKFPKFSKALAEDPSTRRIWYGIATAHDFESHDAMTESKLYQKYSHRISVILPLFSYGQLETFSMLHGKVTLKHGF